MKVSSVSTPRRANGNSVHLAALVIAGSMNSAGAEPQALSGQAIRSAVAGTTVEIDTPIGTKVPVKYNADNSVSGEAGAVAFFLGSAADTGRWWVQNDQLCHRWNIWFKGEKTCLQVSREGDKITWLRDDGETGTATIKPKPEMIAARELSNRRSALGAPDAGRIGQRIVPAAGPAEEIPAEAKIPVGETNPPPVADALPEAPEPSAIAAVPEAEAPAPALPEFPSAAAAAKQADNKAPVQTVAIKKVQVPAKQMVTKRAVSKPRSGAPTFYVYGVAANDVLNVRLGPSAEAQIVGALPPEARGVRMSGGCNGMWCPIEFANQRGWVNRTYLVYEVPDLAAMAR